MIITSNLTPSVYSEESRDYQLFGHLFDLVFNSSKMYIESMNNIKFNKFVDRRLLELIADTLGFNIRHKYDDNNLYFVCKSFKELIRNKGTKKSIENAILLLLRAQGLSDEMSINIVNNSDDETEQYTIHIYVSERIKDLVLFKNLLEYILPTGYVYAIHKGTLDKSTVRSENYTKSIVNSFGKKASELSTRYKIKINDNVKGTVACNSEIIIVGRNEREVSA